MSCGKENVWNDRDDMEDLSDDKIEKLRQMAMDDSDNDAEGFCYSLME